MDRYDSNSTQHSYSYSLTQSISRSLSMPISETGTPYRSYVGNPAVIARGVFQHAVQDALKVAWAQANSAERMSFLQWIIAHEKDEIQNRAVDAISVQLDHSNEEMR